MDSFLRETKNKLESSKGESLLNIHVVLGNESCDLDSAVSALVWAYHLAKDQETQNKWDAIVPVLNIPRHDFPLRTEVTHFLSLVSHTDEAALVFRDDIDLHSWHAEGKLALTLVDHNTLPRGDATLDAAVKEIIDHHSNGRLDDDEREICMTIETVGSCCTLVGEKILAENPEGIDANIAKLLLGPILVDTVNLSTSAGKATAKDIAMVDELSRICPDLDKDQMYEELQQAKADMSGFTVVDILRKDFKCVCGSSMNIGMSSIPMNLKDFVEKPSAETDLQSFCSSKNLRLLVLMALTTDQDGDAHRQICVYSTNSSDSMKDELIQTLDESTSPVLLLSESYTDSPGLVVYSQGNVKASRKQVLPLVKDFLNGQENSSSAEEEMEEEVATGLDLTDMNATLLSLSSNANNGNVHMTSDDSFGMGESQAISSPESSGIDAGSVLLDLDLFPGDQNGLPTSESGTFSSADSAGTLGMTPSSPGSDAVGFGSGTEDLLGLDPFGSVHETVDSAHTPVPDSNPFADSSSSDLLGLDAFMSQPAATSDPSPNPFEDPVIIDYSADTFGVSVQVNPDAQGSEPTSVSLSGNNPFAATGETSSNDPFGLGTFTSTSDPENQAQTGEVSSSEPFSLMDSTVQASVSTTVSSVMDFSGFDDSSGPVNESPEILSSDHSTGSSADESAAVILPISQEGTFEDTLVPDEFGSVQSGGHAEGGLYATPEITITQTSDNDQEDCEEQYSDNFDEESPCDEDQEANDEESSQVDEGFNEHDETEGAASLFDEIMETGTEVEHETEGDMDEYDQEVVSKEVSSEVSREEDEVVTEPAPGNEYSKLEVASASIAPEGFSDMVDPQENDVQSFQQSDQEGTEDQSLEAVNPDESLQVDENGTVPMTGEIKQDLHDLELEENEHEPSVGISTEEFISEASPFKDDGEERQEADPHDLDPEDLVTVDSSLQEQYTNGDDVEPMESSISDSQPVEEVENVVAAMIAQEMLEDRQRSDLNHSNTVETKCEPASVSAEEFSVRPSIAEDVQQDMTYVLGTDMEVANQDVDNQEVHVDNQSPKGSADENGDQPSVNEGEILDADNVNLNLIESSLEAKPEDHSSALEVTEVQPTICVKSDEISDDLQERLQNEGSHITPSEHVDHKDDEELEESQPQQEPEKDASGSVKDSLASDSSKIPDVLPLELLVEERNLSPISDDTPTRSSGITSPESEFTSDIISDDPSSGDSYTVTDPTHDVSHFRIADITEEEEEEEDLVTESTGGTEINIVDTSLEEKLEDLENQTNGDADATLSDEFHEEMGVIEDHFSEESHVQKGAMDTIPILTDVGLCNSGRSSPRNPIVTQDTSMMQEEAHDFVEGVIKMAQFAFKEELRQDQENLGEVPEKEADEEQLISTTEDAVMIQKAEVAVQESENVVPDSEALVNGDVILEESPVTHGKLSPGDQQSSTDVEIPLEPFQQPAAESKTDEVLLASVIQQEPAHQEAEIEAFGESQQDEESPAEQQENTIGLIPEPIMDFQSDDIIQASSVSVESTEPPSVGQTSEQIGKDPDVLQSEVGNEFSMEPVQSEVEEEITQVEVPQEESVITSNNELPSEAEEPPFDRDEEVQALPTDQDALTESSDVSERVELVATAEPITEQGVPLHAEEKPGSEFEQTPKSPIEVNIVISEQGLPDMSSKSEESSTGRTKLLVEDSVKDVDIEVENENSATSMFGLADILEYVDLDGNVEGSAAAVRPSTLSLTARSTTKSTRLLSTGTPGSVLSDMGTPLTPISITSLDLLTSDTGTDEDILDRTQEDEGQVVDSEKLTTPPAAKRCLSIDPDMVEDIHGEWDDKKKLIDAIVEKERRKSQTEKPTHQRELSVATAEAMKNMEGVTLPDEWQDDEFSQQKLAGVDSTQEEESFFRRRVPSKDGKLRTHDSMLSDDGSVEGLSAWAERLAGDDGFDEDEDAEVSPLPANGRDQRHWNSTPKKVVHIPAGLAFNIDGDVNGSATSGALTPTSTELSWDDDDTLHGPGADVEPIPEYTAKEELEDRRNWRKVVIANQEFTVDMRAINPYKKVLSHGGYYGEGVNAIIVLASCYMPERSRKDYSYIMNNLFLYVISTLELLVAQDYMIVYFHGAAPKDRIPSLVWMRKCYQMIDRKLRKNLKGLYIVHPTTWLRTIIRFTRPFISSKFSRKLKFVGDLDELSTVVTMEYVYVPDEVRRVDKQQGKKRK